MTKKIKITKQKALKADESIEIEAFWSSKTINRKWTSIDPHLITVISMFDLWYATFITWIKSHCFYTFRNSNERINCALSGRNSSLVT